MGSYRKIFYRSDFQGNLLKWRAQLKKAFKYFGML